MRKERIAEIVFLAENPSENAFLLRFEGRNLRYLSPDWLSTGAILVKAFKRGEKLKEKPEVFVNPGVRLERLQSEQIRELTKAEYVLNQVREKPVFSTFEEFLNILPLKTDGIRIDVVFKEAPIRPTAKVSECKIDSLDQAITIINFRKDEISNAG